MKYVKSGVVAGIMILTASVASVTVALGQGPIRKQVNYDINVPYEMRMANYLLPAGHYILKQMNDNDVNLFALYRGDMMHSPIAMIRTTRIDYAGRYPEHTRMLVRIDESTDEAIPILRGWNIPGESGWEVIAVVPRHNKELTRIR
jgi:hypothetical protein